MEEIKGFFLKSLEDAEKKVREKTIDYIVSFLITRKTELQKILSDMTRNSYDREREIGIMAKIEEIMQEIRFFEKLK